MPERKVYRYKIDPTAKQEAALSRYAGAPETSSSSIDGFHPRNCVRVVDIAIKSYRSVIGTGNARLVGHAMIEIIMRRKTSGTKE